MNTHTHSHLLTLSGFRLLHIRALVICLGLSLIGLGCADLNPEAEHNQGQSSKSYDYYTYNGDDDLNPWEIDEDESSWSESSDQDYSDVWNDETENTDLWNPSSDSNETDEIAPAHHTSSSSKPAAGSRCAAGCVWSSYAVSIGAQSSEVTCSNGAGCACVEDQNVWNACTANGDSSIGNQSNNSSNNNASNQSPNQSTTGYDANMGRKIADEARYESRRNTVGYCYNAVANAIERITGPFLYGSSAYMAADQLAWHPSFTEAYVNDLRQLPEGAVVVWGRGTSAHGHISIALGNGWEASDHQAPQMTYHYGGAPARVFYPNGRY